MMKTLCEILKEKYTESEYLEKKRCDFEAPFKKAREEIFALGENEEVKASIIASAEQYMQNLFILPGTGGKPYFVGDPPKWDKLPVADEEYMYSLNRLYELPSLCKAYLLTGNEAYAKKALSDVDSWIVTCPRPSLEGDAKYLFDTFQGLTPWRLLECGIRMFDSWNELYQYLLHSPTVTPELHARFVASLYEQAEVISLVSPIAWPDAAHNHYLHEMIGLLIVACRYPELERAQEWRDMAVRELFRAIRAQIMPDGAHIEGCANYHDICLDMIAKCMDVMAEYEIPVPLEIRELIDSAYEYSIWTFTPAGYITSIGDSYMIPKYIPALVDGHYKGYGSVGGYEKILPLVDRAACVGTPDSEFERASASYGAHKGGVRHYRSVGQIIGRTGWTKDDTFFILNCHTPVFNGHSQQDPMNFALVMGGEDVVVDPSYLNYNEDENRRKYKSVKYHSTLTFSDREPYEYLTRWTFGEQKPGSTVRAYEGDGIIAGDAYHENYAPAQHRRLCAMIDKDLFIVCDDVVNPSCENVKLRFHMSTREYTLSENIATNGRVSVHLPKGSSVIIPATKSPFTDIEEPSSIIVNEPEARGKSELYLTVFSARGGISEAYAQRCGDEIVIDIKKDNRSERLHWQFGRYCKRS